VVADRNYQLVIKSFSPFFLPLFLYFLKSAEAVCAVFDRPGPLAEKFGPPLFLTDQDPQGKGTPRSFVSGVSEKFGAQPRNFFATGQGSPDFFWKSKFGMYTRDTYTSD
jgi:hypothetical protein